MTEVYKNPWFKVIKKDEYHYIEEKNSDNGAVILPVVGEQILLVQVYRPAHQRSFLEAPRGYGHAGESSLATALRELGEETGYLAQPEDLSCLGSTRPNSAILTSCIDVYLARLSPAQQQQVPDDEVERLHYFSIAQIPRLMVSGEIQDGFTMAAMALYWAHGF